MIVRSSHDFYDILGLKQGRPQGISHRHSKGSLRHFHFMCEDSLRTDRSPYGSDSERRRKPGQEFVRCPYEL